MLFVFVVQASVLLKVERRDGVGVGGLGDGLVAVVAAWVSAARDAMPLLLALSDVSKMLLTVRGVSEV